MYTVTIESADGLSVEEYTFYAPSYNNPLPEQNGVIQFSSYRHLSRPTTRHKLMEDYIARKNIGWSYQTVERKGGRYSAWRSRDTPPGIPPQVMRDVIKYFTPVLAA